MATRQEERLIQERKLLLSGNEAAAAAAWEAGVVYATGYPGTPSTEILETLTTYPGVRCEWAPNEKVALEVAAGASLAGVRTLVAMKHVGLNVAADPLMTLAYTGVCGGLVVITADDPSMHSSQNEQDNRNYARFAKLPLFEPADSSEVRSFLKEAYLLSERYELPVLFRMTTRLCHSKSVCQAGSRGETKTPGYQKDFVRNVMVPANARVMRVKLEQKLGRLAGEVESTGLNRLERRGGTGIITSGNVYNYVREALPKASILKLGISWPLPRKAIREFAASVERCYVVEELDPFLETEVRALGINLSETPHPPSHIGELSPEAVSALFDEASSPEAAPAAVESPGTGEIAPRPPVLCPGCAHRGVFMTLKKMKLTVNGDIGCYTLGALPPLESMDTCLCMGASIGMAYGLERALAGDNKTRVVAVIGDSTFLHSGITPLLNIVYNGGRTTTIILDNSTTAMTGHNEHPGSGRTLGGEPAPALDYQALARAVGIRFVATVDPYDVDLFRLTVERALEFDGPAVVVARRPCVLLPQVRGTVKPKVRLDPEKCTGCGACFRIGCPALGQDEETGKCRVNQAFCTGCGLCTTTCPCEALEL
ncbi:MAG: indolepyruvate ferredoxin oxidoreductase subunit alpha [Candidatus Glassbacteria bacterium]|nr:indolepyruvate ferredoxin oxidoreductase subunit alpha [Candidatus Glassbacteria bacterium]